MRGHRSGEGLLNYTTEVSVDKTVAEIEAMLRKAGASAILKENAPGSDIITAISFKITLPSGEVAFKLPMNEKAVQQILDYQATTGKIPKRYEGDRLQAQRVGWRIIRQWVEAQLAIIATRMVSTEQVFLPYAVTRNGMTVYEQFKAGGGAKFLLPAGEGEYEDDTEPKKKP